MASISRVTSATAASIAGRTCSGVMLFHLGRSGAELCSALLPSCHDASGLDERSAAPATAAVVVVVVVIVLRGRGAIGAETRRSAAESVGGRCARTDAEVEESARKENERAGETTARKDMSVRARASADGTSPRGRQIVAHVTRRRRHRADDRSVDRVFPLKNARALRSTPISRRIDRRVERPDSARRRRGAPEGRSLRDGWTMRWSP